MWPETLRLAGGADARAPAEHRSRHEPRASWIVVPEQPTHELPGRVEARDRSTRLVENARPLVDREPTVGEGDAAGHRERGERRSIDRVRPVGLVEGETARAAAVLARGVERRPLVDRGVELAHRFDEPLGVDAVEAPGQLLQGR